MTRVWGRRLAGAAALGAALTLMSGCSGDPASTGAGARTVDGSGVEENGSQRFPDVVDVMLLPRSGTTFDVAVTLSSPYDSPERYADGWRVLTTDGTELGSHTLTHDHAAEQPFTRVQPGLEIPADVTTVIVEGRDLVNGYGGGTLQVDVPGR